MSNRDYENVYDIAIDQVPLYGTRNTLGDGTIVIQPPGTGNHLRIRELQLQLIELGPVVVSLKTDTSTTVRSFKLNDDGDGVGLLYPRGVELELPENKGLYINLSDAKAVTYYIRYQIIRNS